MTTATPTQQPAFTLEDALKATQWAKSFVTRYLASKHKPSSKTNPLDLKTTQKLLTYLDELSVELEYITTLPSVEQADALSELAFQNRIRIPATLGSALIITRAAFTDDATLSREKSDAAIDNPDDLPLTRQNFVKLSNQLRQAIEFFGIEYAKSPKSQSVYVRIHDGGIGDPGMTRTIMMMIQSLLYPSKGRGQNSAPAIDSTRKLTELLYRRGFESIKPSPEVEIVPSAGKTHPRIRSSNNSDEISRG